MPWKETCPMNERVKFAGEWLKDERSVASLCREYGISRKTGYKWLSRYFESGASGLGDRSRRPLTSPQAVDEELVALLVAARKERPHWGPRKLVCYLEQINPGFVFPAPSTVGEIFERHGLITKRRRTHRTPPFTQPFASCGSPNDLWCVDFKGHFRTGKTRCYPLTITDACSRFLFRVEGLKKPRFRQVQKVFESAFREFGMPTAIRSDNGPPFASKAPAGLTRLSAWWTKLGIRHERIEPGKPQQNGRHERMHLTLKNETASPPQASIGAQQRVFDLFRRDFNEVRPHEALGQKPPASAYVRSSRPFCENPPEPDYPPMSEVRWVQKNGTIEWDGVRIFVGKSLFGEPVRLEWISKSWWRVYYCSLALGAFDRKSRAKRPLRVRAEEPELGTSATQPVIDEHRSRESAAVLPPAPRFELPARDE